MTEIHIFKYYSNRKIYDTEKKKMSNQNEILKSIKSGRIIRVVEKESGDDITNIILFQIMIAELKENPERMNNIMQAVIAKGPDAIKEIQDYAEKKVSGRESLNLVKKDDLNPILKRIKSLEKLVNKFK